MIRNLLLLCFICVSLMTSCSQEESKMGDQHFIKGEFKQAIKVYDEYLTLHPTHIKSIYNRGRCYEELGNFERALENYKEVLEIDPKNLNANLSIGKDYYRSNDFENALFYFDKAFFSNNSSAQALFLRARANHNLGNTDVALNDYNSAINLDKELGEAYLYRGALKILIKRKSSACSDFKSAKALGVKGATDAMGRYCN